MIFQCRKGAMFLDLREKNRPHKRIILVNPNKNLKCASVPIETFKKDIPENEKVVLEGGGKHVGAYHKSMCRIEHIKIENAGELEEMAVLQNTQKSKYSQIINQKEFARPETIELLHKELIKLKSAKINFIKHIEINKNKKYMSIGKIMLEKFKKDRQERKVKISQNQKTR